APEQRVVLANKHGENLVGMLHHAGSNKVVVLCHGFAACKDDSIMIDLAAALTKQGISAFRFDFSGNGPVISYLYQEKYDVTAIVGHSKGGSVVVLYASIYGDAHMVVNLSGQFYLEKGIEECLGKEFMDRINKEGYIDVMNESGKVLYRVTKESLMERLNTDMHAASLSISKECRFFTVHGSADKIIPVEDAYEFARLVTNHKLHVIKRANHGYTSHRKQLCDAVINCITSNEVQRNCNSP
uniref:Serine aminopeptidase S33 domain-containing protein n=1 Tax=Setaria italica TaxID=4555 RepID=K3XQH4_SETIT